MGRRARARNIYNPFQQMKPLAVILHLYYQDLWDEFSSYFDNITVDFDLYVSLVEGNDTEEASSLILGKYPNAKIYVMPNRGMDVAPFIYTFDQIIKSGLEYECFIKVHSKKSLHESTGNYGKGWRNALLNAILGTPLIFEKCFAICNNNSDYGMAQNVFWVLPQGYMNCERDYFKGEIPESYSFIGGTMFIANFDIFKKWFKENNIFELTYDKFPDGYSSDHTIAHILERILGLVPTMYGKQIYKIVL
jgi:lipopolysaccharide biosynthesis protein